LVLIVSAAAVWLLLVAFCGFLTKWWRAGVGRAVLGTAGRLG
jgi:hypothetical protein